MNDFPPKNSHCIVRLKRNKYKFVEILSSKKDYVKAVICSTTLDEEPEYIKIDDPSRIILSFEGKVPYGKAYNCKIEYVRKSEDNNDWGTINYFRNLKESDKKFLEFSLSKAHKLFKSYHLLGVLPIHIDVKYNHGKIVGLFNKYDKHRKSSIMTLTPFEFEEKHLMQIITHEYGHGLWWYCMNDHLKYKWIETYHLYIKLANVDNKLLVSIRKKLENSESIKEFYNNWEKDTELPIRIIMREVFSRISKVHKLSKDDIDILIRNRKSLQPYWPLSLNLGDVKQILTDYARKNVREFFCEAFMLFMCKKKLPKKIKKLMKATVATSTKKIIEDTP